MPFMFPRRKRNEKWPEESGKKDILQEIIFAYGLYSKEIICIKSKTTAASLSLLDSSKGLVKDVFAHTILSPKKHVSVWQNISLSYK